MGLLRRRGPLLRQPLPVDSLDTSGAHMSKQEPFISVTALPRLHLLEGIH